MAPQKQLENTRIARESDPHSHLSAPSFTMAARVEEQNVLMGQPLHPIKHALQIFTDTSKKGWGAHLNERTARGSWSVPESKLHINYLELKAVFLALKEFQDLCTNQIVLVATDNTTVVSYINKEGGMRQAHFVPYYGEFPDMQQVALASDRLICHEVQQQVASVCVTSTGSPGHSSGCTQSAMGGSGCIRLPILAKVVEKLQDTPCKRIILIALGGPTCLGFGIWWPCPVIYH